jgi:hypothetical protein
VLVVGSRRKLLFPLRLCRSIPRLFIELYKLLFSKLILSFFYFIRFISCSGQQPLSGFQEYDESHRPFQSIHRLICCCFLLACCYFFSFGVSCCCLCLWGCVCLCFDFQPRCTTHDTPRTTWTIVANDLEHGKYFQRFFFFWLNAHCFFFIWTRGMS